MRYCSKCGAEIKPGINFCVKCGKEIVKVKTEGSRKAERVKVENVKKDSSRIPVISTMMINCEVFNMKISKELLNEMIMKLPSELPETGGIIGGNCDVVTLSLWECFIRTILVLTHYQREMFHT